MRPTLTELRRWELDDIMGAVAEIRTAARELNTALATATGALAATSEWHGLTRNAAQTTLASETDHAEEVANTLQQVADEAHDAHTDLTHARAYVLDEASAALAAGCEVSDTGLVRHPDKPDDAAGFQTRIQGGLDSVDDFDERYGGALDALSGDLAAMVNGQPDITGLDGAPIDPDDMVLQLQSMSPADRAAYLGRLSPDEIRLLTQAAPEAMGNMDGAPFELRFVANEVNVRNALDDEIRAGRGEGPRAQKLRELLGHQPDPLADRERGADDQSTERTLLTFENTPNGRWVEVIGALTPETANITTYIPGTGTTLNGSGPNYRSAWELARASKGPVIVYADGDFPQGTQAVETSFAEKMAPRLVDFGDTLGRELDRVAPQATTTFIGHSYGGAILGSAEQIGLKADNAIYASSAGTGVYDGEWKDSNVKRFSLTAPGDLIHLAQALPGNPHGDDPDSMPGVTRLDTGFYTDGREVLGVEGHGGYWNDSGSDAFQNMVAVITGEPPTPYVNRGSDIPVAAEAERGLAEVELPTVAPHTRDRLDQLIDELLPDSFPWPKPGIPGLPFP